MRERTTWSRQKIAYQLQKVAEDPRSMNQDHLDAQPAADAYIIGDGTPSQFAEDVNTGKGGWKADKDGDGNTKRNELGMPEFRSDTFDTPDHSPGVSPSRQASLSIAEVNARAELATRAARIMLPKTASEQAIEDQALLLMDLPTASLQSTVHRLAQEQQDDDDDDDDDGQGKQAQQQDDDDDDDDGQGKQAKRSGLPPEFLEQQQKMKDKAKDGDKDDKKDDKKDETKKARSRRAADQDDKKQSQQQDKDKKQNDKEARARWAEEQDDDDGQDKQARARSAQQQDDDDDGQDKQAADQDDKKQSQQDKDKEMGKEASDLIRLAAVGLLQVPQVSRQAAYKAMLPMLLKTAAQGLQQQLSQQQLQSQVQELVQQAMQQQQQQQQQLGQGQQQPHQDQQQMAQGQQQLPQLDDNQVLVDQLFQEPEQEQVFASEDSIQMDSPTMDIGDVSFGPEDNVLKSIFASDTEFQRALQARNLQNGTTPTTRTASMRTVGTRPTEGVSHLGGGVANPLSSASEEITRLSSMWSSAPDVSGVFRS